MLYHEMTIAGLKRQLPLFPVSDDLSIAAFIMLGDVEINEAAAKELLAKAPEFDIILTAEAKSIPLAHEMAKLAGQNDYIVARKGLKVYMEDPLVVSVESITTAYEQHLYLGKSDVEKMRGKRVLVLDDVISTGASLNAIEALAAQAGANIVAKMAVLAEGDAMDRGDIIALDKLPVFNPDGTIKE